MRKAASKITCHLNVKDGAGNLRGESRELPLASPNGTTAWREHPDPNVDVMAFEVTELINSVPEMEKKWADYRLFADAEVLDGQDITAGEEILVIGYPNAYTQGESNLPIVRQGIIASQIGHRYVEQTRDGKGKLIRRELRGFLIDGGIIPGSSGSPVVLKPTIGRRVGDNIVVGTPQLYLLGMVAEYRLADIATAWGTSKAYAGLGFAYDASTVKETIELFFQQGSPPAKPATSP